MIDDVVLNATEDMIVEASARNVMSQAQFGDMISRGKKMRRGWTTLRKTPTGERLSCFVRVTPFAEGDLIMHLDIEQLMRRRKPVVSVSGHGHWPKAGHIMAKGAHVLSEPEFAELLPPDAQSDTEFAVSVAYLLRADQCEPTHSLPIRPSDVTTVPYDLIIGQRYAKLSGDKLVYNVIVESSPSGWWACVAFGMQGRLTGEFLKGVAEHGTRITRLFIGRGKD